MAIDGGFDKTEVCGKMVRNFMGPGLQLSVSPNSQIFNLTLHIVQG